MEDGIRSNNAWKDRDCGPPMVIEQIAQSNVSIYAHSLGMETRLPSGRPNPAMGLIVAIMIETAAQETERNAERIVLGQQEAKRKGVHIGRPAGSTTSDAAPVEKHKLVEGFAGRPERSSRGGHPGRV